MSGSAVSLINLDNYDLNKVFFTADQHFGHANIIKFCNRPFSDAQAMDYALIDKWNAKVPPDGIVFHLGDFTLGDSPDAVHYFGAVNGTIKILANPWHHDKRWLGYLDRYPDYPYRSASNHPVEILPPLVMLERRDGEKWPLPIMLCHYPMGEWDRSHYGAWHLHGHSHGKYRSERGGRIMDVGADNCGYAPISFGDVFEWMERFDPQVQP